MKNLNFQSHKIISNRNTYRKERNDTFANSRLKSLEISTVGHFSPEDETLSILFVLNLSTGRL